MAKRNVAQELVFQLAEIGVSQVFGITGDALNAFTDAIRNEKRIDWFTVRHEETAAFAAAAQAEISGELAVCAATIGPGAIHLINGLYNAKRDRSPVLAITGQVPREEADGPYFQEVDQNKLFDDCCVFSATLQSVDQMPRILQQAIDAAIYHRGVAHLAIPTDIALQAMKIDNQVLDLPKQRQVLAPIKADLDKAAELINQAKRVSLLIGCGCRGASAQVSQLASHLQAPVCHSLKGSEVLAYDHPYSIGGIGHVGTPHGLAVIEECDLLVIIGSDFPYKAFLPKHGNIIQVDINATHLGRRCPITHGIVADSQTFITQLLPLLQQKTDNPSLAKLQQKRDAWIEKANDKFAQESSKSMIHPQSVVLKCAELANDDAIFVAEVGEVTVWAARHLRMRGKQRLIGSFNHGSLGVGLAAAIGAQSLDKNRQVFALCGDGAFTMLMSDLITASRYQLPLIAIVLNNEKFGFVELEMEASGMPRFATDLVNPDFVKVAQAHGCVGIRVEKLNQLEDAIKQATASPQPVVIDVIVNPHELIIPPKLDPLTAYKFTQGKLREMLIEKDLKVLFER